MRYTNEKWFDAIAEQVMHNMKVSRNEDEKKHWIKRGLKKAFTEGAHKEIVIRTLEQAK